MTEYIKINSDEWEDAGKIYKVVSYFRRKLPESTAVELTIENEMGETISKVVPYHWIEWSPEENISVHF